jgi:RND superfamily putative drug exporter
VSRRGARLALGAAVVVFVGLLGLVGSAQAPGNGPAAPPNSESARAAQALAQLPDGNRQSVLVVATRSDENALTDADLASLRALAPMLDGGTGEPASPPMASKDGRAAVLTVPVSAGGDNVQNAEMIKDLRSVVDENTPQGLSAWVTGGPAFGVDVAAAFDGADFTLLAVTVLIVAVLLIVTYRSPILWLIPLVVVGFADQLAGKVTASLGDALGLYFDAGVVSVLVFGAGTNYALLLISRYREELRLRDDHRAALAHAWRTTVPAIVASNVTVVLALLTLVFAVIPGTRGLGISAAVGLVIALLAVVFVLPPALAMCGRKVFWPFVPSPDAPGTQGTAWGVIASRVMGRPVMALGGGLAILAVMAVGLFGTSVGLTQVEKFRVPSQSAAGLDVLSQHFEPGAAQPLLIVANSQAADEVVQAATAVPGVVRASTAATSGPDGRTEIVVTGSSAPGTPESLDLVADVRDAVHAVPGADALVGGAVATDVDARAGNHHDLLLVAPLVLAVVFVVLMLLLRSLVAPVLLLAVNLASAAAAIGAGSWLSRTVFGWPALDLQVPLLAFLFLVALGIDYTIFLVHRARSEAALSGTRAGMTTAVARTGGVITSGGIVLAGVFAALGVLPLVTLGQLGLIVGVGVVVDTLLVRTVIVPALFGVLGDRIWWPGHRGVQRAESTHERDESLEPSHAR